MGVFPVIFLTAESTTSVSGGTTEETTAPSIEESGRLWIAIMSLILTAYSRSVFPRFVVTRSTNQVRLSSIPPITILLFPMSIAKIIKGTPFQNLEVMVYYEHLVRFFTNLVRVIPEYLMRSFTNLVRMVYYEHLVRFFTNLVRFFTSLPHFRQNNNVSRNKKK